MSALLLENKPLVCSCGAITAIKPGPGIFFPFWCECDDCLNCEAGETPADAEQAFFEMFLKSSEFDRYCWMIGPDMAPARI